jgi:hypothetical protein
VSSYRQTIAPNLKTNEGESEMKQIEMFPDLTTTLTEAEEQELQHMMNTSQLNAGTNGTTADDIQVSGNHYKDMAIQPWHIMEAVLTHDEFVGFLKGNIIKYSLRAGRKDGSDDAGKAKHYMQKLKEIRGY